MFIRDVSLTLGSSFFDWLHPRLGLSCFCASTFVDPSIV